MLRFRTPRYSDLEAAYAISLATGFAGADASQLYEDPHLIGHIYSAPYICLQPELALVAEDDGGVGGFVVGAAETLAWEDRLERDWWPTLRMRYSDPVGEASAWTPDQRRWAMIHHPERTPYAVAHDYPAHVHLNLLPRMQRQGIGTGLLRAWLALRGQRMGERVHVGVNWRNAGAKAFWERQGFNLLSATDVPPRPIWLGWVPRVGAS